MTLLNKNKTCEGRIDVELEAVIKDIEYMINQKGSVLKDREGTEYKSLSQWINAYALCYEDDLHYRAKNLVISMGGPSEGIRFFKDGTIEYYFQDWFDGAKRELFGKNYEIAKELYDRCFTYKR
jgi:hypothetical protein